MITTTSDWAGTRSSSASRSTLSGSLMRLAAVTAACVALTLPALAQSPTPMAPSAESPTAQPHQGLHRADHAAQRAQWKQKRAARHAERLSRIHQALALSPAQEAAWTTFEQALQPAQRHTAQLDRQGWKQLTTPERIDRVRVMQTQRAAAMEARGDATKAFYAQLQPAQQKTFDQASMSLMRHGHRGGREHPGGRQASESPNKG